MTNSTSWRGIISLNVDEKLLKEFELGLDPKHPDESAIPACVLGYGEISTVFEIKSPGQEEIAYKRMPIFFRREELGRYREVHDEYVRLLAEEVGLELPEFAYADITGASGAPVFFIAQRRLPRDSICNNVIHTLDEAGTCTLVIAVLQKLSLVWKYNSGSTSLDLGIDGQISNWAIKDYGLPAGGLPDRIELLYLDTSTPLFRIDGEEQLDAELFLRSAPSFMVWLLRSLFLQDVLDRYHDFHLVAIDLVANFYKEQLPERIPALVETVNEFFARSVPELGIEPITEKQVRSYYREDAMIWRLYLSMRKLDRFLKTKIARKPYPYILPGTIKR